MRIPLRFGLAALALFVPGISHAVLFDFENAPLHTPLPIDLTVEGVTAHFSGTGQGFSIQRADAMGFTPAGFSGNCIYPSSVYQADLIVDYSVLLTDFSILYAPQELGCDDSARMRVTVYKDGVFVATATTTAYPPGTWPTGTLSISAASGFNRAVVHYDQRPACGDWGPIFMADNINVTPKPTIGVEPDTSPPRDDVASTASPNPFAETTTVVFGEVPAGNTQVLIVSASGRLVAKRTVSVEADEPIAVRWDGRDDAGRRVPHGIYSCLAISVDRVRSLRLVWLGGE
ncbi:MAG: FlgD immunoglobulin-like domain containing protein [Candidatus Eisenbacteria bacterium]